MNKADLSAKWSKYCNTDQLVDDVRQLLTQYRHRNSEHGVCTLLDEYFTNKESLIRLFATSPHYIGAMRIGLAKKFDRQPDKNGIYGFFTKNYAMFNSDKLLRFVDEDGKRMSEYLNTGKTAMNVFKMPDIKRNDKLQKFNYRNGALKESYYKSLAFREYVDYFRYNPYSKTQTAFTSHRHKNAPVIVAGTKTSRAFHKACTYYGFDKLDPRTVSVTKDGKETTKTVYPYDQVFAQYADLVAEGTKEMSFIISLNPLDYLTMSFGVSWESCHNIRRGGWMGGCLSYMLDNASIITFVVNELNGPIHKIPKVYRQMFHYDGDMFVQSRLYPQGNDGAVNLYDKFRGFVTEEFSSLLNVNNEWDAKEENYDTYTHINSEGSHYRDYGYSRNCRTFYHRTKVNNVNGHKMTIGHQSICVNCGEPLAEKGALSHHICAVPATRNTTTTSTFTITLDDWA